MSPQPNNISVGTQVVALVEIREANHSLVHPTMRIDKRVLFECAKPKTIVITTPNREFNVKWKRLPAGHFRHRDHRFEWTPAEFQDWANLVAARFGCGVRFLPVGQEDPAVGSPTQMGVFERKLLMDRIRRAAKLMRKGCSYLDEYRYANALKVGRELKKLRHSSAFEILALAYWRLDKLPMAIKVLEEGVAKAGRIWILWELLGNCYSDAGLFAKAERAYHKALKLETCDQDAVHLNRAIAFNRAGKHAEAKSALKLVKSPRLRRRRDACRIRTAMAVGDAQFARQLALRLSKCPLTRTDTFDRISESEILLSCALALRGNPDTKGKVLRLAYRAADEHPNNVEALALIREIRQRKAAGLVLFRLFVHGVWSGSIGDSSVSPGFFRTLEVAAASQPAALRYAKLFFPKPVRKSLSIEEAITLDGSSLSLEGVYCLSGYAFHARRRKN
jgi:tetratricopeptide (TPR) repeat protein